MMQNIQTKVPNNLVTFLTQSIVHYWTGKQSDYAPNSAPHTQAFYLSLILTDRLTKNLWVWSSFKTF